MPGAPSRDVAIYAPYASAFYDPNAQGGGGAEFQTTQLAAGLARNGLRVAHIVFPVGEVAIGVAGLELVQRPSYLGAGGALSKLREARAIWRGMRDANARVYILRGRGLHELIGPLFARLRRRRIILSGSNDFDFTGSPDARGRLGALVYRWATASVDAVVAQTEVQGELAKAAFGQTDRITVIPSFAERAEPADGSPQAFLWPARLIDYKRPLKYVELAAAVPEAKFRMVCVPTARTAEAAQQEQALEREVRDRAAGLDNLELLDWRPRSELLDLVSEAIAIVVTSESEGMPNVFLEAWTRAIPVLSLGFDPDGRIESRSLGIAADEDWDRFVDGAKRLWGDPELRAKLGDAGRKYVIETHDPDAVIARWLTTLRSVESSLR